MCKKIILYLLINLVLVNSIFGASIHFQEEVSEEEESDEVFLVTWHLDKTFAGDTFFDNFHFFHDKDPSHGTVEYVDKVIANSLNLIGVENGKVRISVDSTNVFASDEGRPSLRLESHTRFNDGLFILDLDHIPTGPGTWPAWWFVGDSWPQNGEIDVLEGVYQKTTNNQALHTRDGCYMPLDASIFKGTWTKGSTGKIDNDCYVDAPGQNSAGCSITSQDGYFGVPFNNASGGVYAFEWQQNTSMKIWIFHRNEVPTDIISGNPIPSSWGKPQAFYTLGYDKTCTPDHFVDHMMVINTDLCGDWAGGAYPGGWPACNDKVRSDPASYKEAYWLINYLKYFSR